MAERRCGVVKWFEVDKDYRTAFGFLKRAKRLHSTYSSSRI